MSEPTPPDLQRAFGLSSVSDTSLTPWATVLRCTTEAGIDGVVKVTARKPHRADAMAAWTRELAAQGVPVVAPLELDAPNPRRVGDAWWVVYPFVDGRPYVGGVADAHAAGDLLGRIHTADVTETTRAVLR